jgi:perosamine synthetase
MKNIPWANPLFDKKEFNQIKKSFKKNQFTMGANVSKFEKKFSKTWNSRYSVAVSNGTVALDLALKSISIKNGDEVIVPAVSYISTASAVSYQGATPVFVDICPNVFSINPSKIQKAITNKTKAIIYIDYGGIPANLKAITQIAKKNKIPLILDGAQTLGAKINNIDIGHNGLISTVSFHMAKIITTIEGGMISTNSKKIDTKLRTLRNIGEPKNKKYSHTELGTNARMNELQAGIGIEQLKKLNFFVKERNRIAKSYINLFNKYKLQLELPIIPKNNNSSYFFFPILIKKRNYIASKLKAKFNIDTRIAYPTPLYNQPMYKKGEFNFKKYDCINAEIFCKKILNLPIFPNMKKKEIEIVVSSLKKCQDD